MYKSIILFYLILNSSFCFAQRLPESIVKIGVQQNMKSFNLGCEGAYYLFELNTGKKTDIKPTDIYLVTGEDKTIKFNGNTYASPLRIVPTDPKSRVTINGRKLRDTVLIICKDSKLSVVNELGLEDYIYGILPREVDPTWPLESLKAHAVVSRSYALANLGKHDKDGFDLCTTVHCQVYGGVDCEDPRSNKAVEDTRGEVVVYNNKLASVFFHACCAGHTESPTDVWNYESEAPKYLAGHSCRFCKNSPYMNWKNEISAEQIRKKLLAAGYNTGEVSKIKRVSKTGSGRIKNLMVIGSKGTITITAARFRLVVAPDQIRSTFLSDIKKKGNKFVFYGSGWGHGVGMCQWGSKTMGEKGYDYKAILKYYFPKTEVQKWDE
jgi:stage II sporulation protein D